MKNKIALIISFLFFSILYSQESNEIQRLKEKLKFETSDTAKINLNIHLSNSFNDIAKDSSQFYFDEALKLAEVNSFKLQLATKVTNIGIDFEENKDFKHAISNYKRAVLIFDELEDFESVADLYNYIGYCYINLYAEDKAIEFYLKSLKIYKDLNNEDGIAMNYIDIGNLYYDQGNYSSAKLYFQDALTVYEKLEDNWGIATCYTNLGNAFSDDGDYEQGIDYFKQSIVLENELDDQEGIAINYNNLGDCYIQLMQFEQAHFYFNESLKIAKSTKDEELESLVYLNIADIFVQQKNFEQTIFYANKSLKIARELGKLEFELDDLLFLGQAYEEIGNSNKALVFYKQHYNVKDSLFSSDKEKKVQLFNALNELEKTHFTITDLSSKNEIAQLKYETEKKISYFLITAIIVFAFLVILLIHQQTDKKKAYNLLEFRNYQINKMNKEIQEQRDDLKQMNRTKDKFFSIIAHDLKNPFNSIKGFTGLLIENNDQYDDEKQLKFLRIIKDSTNKASVLLNNLLIWANSQSGNLAFAPKRIELVGQVMDAVSLLEIQAIKKEIEIYNNVDHNLSVKADKNMLNTILRNLISNAIKFTKPNGEIRILSKCSGNMVEISVKDNGVGISEDNIENLFSIDQKSINVGTANEKGSGLGLVLCKDFIEKNGGEIWVNSIINEGSEFVFTLPLFKDEIEDI